MKDVAFIVLVMLAIVAVIFAFYGIVGWAIISLVNWIVAK